MSTYANSVRVGTFVMGGFALLILGILLLGGKNLFSDEVDYVLYFDGSVSGLSVGAPVVLRGVPLGHVVRINLVANMRDENITIPVYININERAIVRMGGSGSVTDEMREDMLRRLVRRGLRARLQLQSLITGQYRIELDFFPDTPARYHSVNHAEEIPTVPSPIDELQRTLQRLPLDTIIANTTSILQGLNRFVNDDNLSEAVAAIRGTFEQSHNILKDSKPMREDLQRLLNTLDNAALTVDKQLPGAVAAFQLAMHNFASAVAQVEYTIKNMDGLASRDSRTVRDFQQALRDVSEAARAIRALATLLERQPESLLRGKGGK